MNDSLKHGVSLPPEQQAIRDKCFHPSGTFVEFSIEDVETSIPARFEKIVRKYPDRIAVKTRNHTFTYDTLNEMANRVARALGGHRGDGNKSIALLLENDAPLIAAILGVLKAGKIYVPLDPSLPRTRITYILEDSQAGLFVTNNNNLSLAKTLPKNALQLINIDDLDSSLVTDNLQLSLPPETLAYIIYTSGSTGRPKGVIQNHRNVLHFVMRHTNAIHLCSDDRQTLLYSCNVNGAVRDIFSALLNGASLFPLDIKKEELVGLAEWLIREEISIYCSVSTVFRHFIHTLSGNDKFPKLRLIKIGGEPAYRYDVELYKKYFSPDCILCSGLGATETGTTVTRYFVDKNTAIIGNIVPLGYSVEDLEVLLLDEAAADVGLERVGEIAIKSRYLSPGYWGRPDLTQAAFVSATDGGDERIYRSGDLGRMYPDGCLNYLGRKDFQVKVRGHRIETAEIEMALLRLGAINDAVVVAREDRPGDTRLLAYVVAATRPGPTAGELRRFLKEKLPDYMIPSAFVMMNSLPRLPNGKIDRKALPDPKPSRPDLQTAFVGPGNSTEATLARIWAEVLSLEQVGIQDNFFDLGGHSLAASRVISRVVQTFKLELPVKALFDAPTVAEMAAIITENQAKRASEEALNRMLSEVEAMTEEEAQKQLAGERARSTTGDGHD